MLILEIGIVDCVILFKFRLVVLNSIRLLLFIMYTTNIGGELILSKYTKFANIINTYMPPRYAKKTNRQNQQEKKKTVVVVEPQYRVQPAIDVLVLRTKFDTFKSKRSINKQSTLDNYICFPPHRFGHITSPLRLKPKPHSANHVNSAASNIIERNPSALYHHYIRQS